MDNLRLKAEALILKAFDNLSQAEQKSLRPPFTVNSVGKRRINKNRMPHFMQSMFPHLPTALQFEVLVGEVQASIQAHAQRLTNYGKEVLHVSVLEALYKKYEDGLRQVDAFPSIWFGDQVGKADRQEVVQLICYVSIQKMYQSLAYLKQDLQAIEKESVVKLKNMRYTLTLFGVSVRFNGLVHQPISDYAPDKFVHIYNLPTFAGKYATEVQKYLFENQLNLQYQAQANETNTAVFAHNLETALTHYKTTKTFNKIMRFEAELQGGAGVLNIGIYPWKFKAIKISKHSPILAFSIFLLNAFNASRGLSYILDFFFVAIGVGILGVMAFGGYKKRLWRAKIDTKTDMETAYLAQYTAQEEAICADTTYNAVLEKLYKDLNTEIAFKDWGGKVKKYGNPIDILKLYKNKLRETEYMDLVYLRNFDLDVQKPLCLAVMQYLLKRKIQKSLHHFMEVVQLLITHDLEATIYLRFFSLSTTTNGFYGGGFWTYSKVANYQMLSAEMQALRTQTLACPPLYGDNHETFSNWISMQEQSIEETYLAIDMAQMKHHIALYHASKGEKTPFIMEMEEMVIYF